LGSARLLAPVIARLVVALARFVGAAFAVLVGLPIAVVGLVGRFGSLASGSTVASRRVRGTGPSGDRGSAAGWIGGQHRRAFPPWRHNTPAGVGVRDDQGKADTEGGPKQRSHDDQDLPEVPKRLIHEVSNIEKLSHRYIADAA
jgi:hypothetical protein